MKPTEVLEREHQVIEQVAAACGTCAAALRKGVRIPFDILRSTVASFVCTVISTTIRKRIGCLRCCGRKGFPREAVPWQHWNTRNKSWRR